MEYIVNIDFFCVSTKMVRATGHKNNISRAIVKMR